MARGGINLGLLGTLIAFAVVGAAEGRPCDGLPPSISRGRRAGNLVSSTPAPRDRSHLDPFAPPRLESADPLVGAHRSFRHRS